MGTPTPWHKGRVVLMGDAVHAITPHLGQGAAQAIEDGVVLADALSRHDNLDTAFAEYTARRYERCKLIVDTSLAIGEWEMGRLPGFDNVAATNHVLDVMAQAALIHPPAPADSLAPEKGRVRCHLRRAGNCR
ncbi:FAD-dependent monooxygenase [Microbacterium elymi]